MTQREELTIAARLPLPHQVRILVTARAVNRLGAFSLPFLSLQLSRGMHVSLSTVGLVLSCFGAASMVSRVAGGRLADGWGRRRTMVAGLVGCSVAQLGIAVSTSLVTVAISVVLLGLAFEIYEPPCQAFIADAVDAAGRATAFAALGASLSVAALGAGVVATVVAPLSLRLLFVVDAASCLVAGLVVLCWLPRDHPRGPTPKAAEGQVGSARSPWRHPLLVFLFVANTVFAACYLQVATLLPLTLERRQVAAYGYGVLVVTASLVMLSALPVLRRGSRAVGAAAMTGMHARAIAGGHLLLAAGLAGYGVADTLTGFVIATVIGATGEVVLAGHVLALVSTIAPAVRRGRYLASFGLSWGAAAAVGPVPATLLLAEAGDRVLWEVCAAGCAAVAAGYAAVARMVRPGRAPAWAHSSPG